MPISNKHKLIFIHIPKTGGLSMMSMLEIEHKSENLYGVIRDNESFPITGSHCSILQHLSALEVKKLCPEYFDSYHKFTVVRNPYDRIVSIYNYQQHLGINHHLHDPSWSFGYFVRNLRKNFLKIREVSSHNGYCHFIPQIDFIYDKNTLLVDAIIKFEDYSRQVSEFLKRFRINSNMVYENVSSKNVLWHDMYTPELKDIVYSIYEQDFIKLNYRK